MWKREGWHLQRGLCLRRERLCRHWYSASTWPLVHARVRPPHRSANLSAGRWDPALHHTRQGWEREGRADRWIETKSLHIRPSPLSLRHSPREAPGTNLLTGSDSLKAGQPGRWFAWSGATASATARSARRRQTLRVLLQLLVAVRPDGQTCLSGRPHPSCVDGAARMGPLWSSARVTYPAGRTIDAQGRDHPRRSRMMGMHVEEMVGGYLYRHSDTWTAGRDRSHQTRAEDMGSMGGLARSAGTAPSEKGLSRTG